MCRQKRSLLQAACSQLGTVVKSSKGDTHFEDVQCNRISFIHKCLNFQENLKNNLWLCVSPIKYSAIPHSCPTSLTLVPSSQLALLLQLSVIMLSLSKIVLFSLISFATLALAIPAPEPRSANTKALFAGANNQLVNTMYPVGSSLVLLYNVVCSWSSYSLCYPIQQHGS